MTHGCRWGITVGLFAALAAMTVMPAHAQVIFTLGNNPQPGEENVLLSNGTSGTTVTGTTNTTGKLVQFTSTSDTLFEPSSGQARISTGTDENANPLNNVTFSVPGGTFTDAIFNPFIGGAGAPNGGTATVTVTPSVGANSTFDYTLGNGSNFLTITTTGGTLISSVTIDSTNGFTDLRQIRLSGVTGGGGGGGGVAVPEPGTLAMLAGLVGPGLLIWRRRRS